ncbi:hypothetical protein EDD15DRAFT_2358156 [Pisolithus albus]|nr:hypothetical protein EDD15DRAFT_2358156 [Pisolithus albus]
MPNHGWTTPDQLAWLMGKLPKYQEISELKNYSLFWPSCFETWFKQWPERLASYPDVPLDQELTAEQSTTVNNAILARKNKIRSWFRWRTNASRTNRSVQKQNSILVGLADPKKKRALARSEIYSKNYYKERIKPALDAEIQAGNVEDTSSARLAMTRRLSKKLLSTETNDVKLAVEKLYMEQERHISQSMTEETDPEKILRNIEDLPILLERVGELIHRRTGFIVSYLCAGPNPKNNWNISATSYHIGKTSEGNDFSMIYPALDEDVLAAFIDFAELVYPPDRRKSPVNNVTGSSSSVDPSNHDYPKNDTDELSRRETDLEGREHGTCDTTRGHDDTGSLYNVNDVNGASPAVNSHDTVSAIDASIYFLMHQSLRLLVALPNLRKPAQAITTWQVAGLTSSLTPAGMSGNEDYPAQTSHCPPVITSVTDNWENVNENTLLLDWGSSGCATPCSSVTNFSLDDILTEGFNTFGFDVDFSSSFGTLPDGPVPNSDTHNLQFDIPSTSFIPDFPQIDTAIQTSQNFEDPVPHFNFTAGSFSAAMADAIPSLPCNHRSPAPPNVAECPLDVSSASKDIQEDECTDLRGKQSVSEQGMDGSCSKNTQQASGSSQVDMRRSSRVPKKSTREELMNAIGSNPSGKKRPPSSVTAGHPKSKKARMSAA